jgi:hypothetical protein
MGDCWGIWDFVPEFDDDKGTSLILSHSKLGDELLKELNEQCSFLPILPKAALAKNRAVTQSIRPHIEKAAVCRILLQKNDFAAAAALINSKSLFAKVKRAVLRFCRKDS